MKTGSSHRLLSGVLALVVTLVAFVVQQSVPNDAAAQSSCVTTDQALITAVADKVTRHSSTGTGRTDLHEMFSRSHQTMLGTDTYTTTAIKARPDKQGDNWQGSGSNPLWQQVYAELDRLEACRDELPDPDDADDDDDDVPLQVTPTVSIAGGAGVSEGTAASFTIAASPATSAALTVSVTVSQSGNFAASGKTGSKSVEIPTSGSKTYTVDTVNDSIDEANGSITVTITSGSGYTVGTTASATVTVADNDPTPPSVISITAGPSVTEGEDAVFTISANPAPSKPLTVWMDVYRDHLVTTEWGTRQAFPVIPANAASIEYKVPSVVDPDVRNGRIFIHLLDPRGYTRGSPWQATVPVLDKDRPPEVSISGGAGITEGGAATFTLTADPKPKSPLTVSLTVSQSGDFAASGATGAKSVTIPTSGSKTYTVNTVDDGRNESDGSLSISVDSGSGYNVGKPSTATVLVADNDVRPPGPSVVSIAAGAGVTEGQAATFTITAYPVPLQPLTVSLSVSESGGFAVAGDTGSKSITIPTSGSAIYSVDTVNDLYEESDGSVTVAVGSDSSYTIGTPSSATVSVADNDLPTEVSIRTGANVTEGRAATFTISVYPKPIKPLTVYFTVSQYGEFAAAGTLGSKSVTIPVSGSKTYTVVTVDDSDIERNGFIRIRLTSGDGYRLKPYSQAQVRVSDNEAAPVVTISGGAAVTEGRSAIFTISTNRRLGPNGLLVTVGIRFRGDFASSTYERSRLVIIPPWGSESEAIWIHTRGDATDEPHGSVTVSISSSSDYTVGRPSSATVTILDDDAPALTSTVDLDAPAPTRLTVKTLSRNSNHSTVLVGWPSYGYDKFQINVRGPGLTSSWRWWRINWKKNWVVFENVPRGRHTYTVYFGNYSMFRTVIHSS